MTGDASCADHNIAWNVRYKLKLDHVPAGVADGGNDDNIIYHINNDINNVASASGFGHPECTPAATAMGKALPRTRPIGHLSPAWEARGERWSPRLRCDALPARLCSGEDSSPILQASAQEARPWLHASSL